MIRFEFGVEDLARARFAISPMLELVSGLRVIRDPGHAAMHVPWVRAAVPIARRLRLATVFALAPPTGFVPDFLTPPPTSPVVSFEDELERVRRTDAEQIRADVRAALAGRRPSGRVRELLDDPVAGLAALTDALERFWHEALADHWPRIRALLEADIAHRAQRLTTGGPVDLFADLHPDVTWIGGHLEVAVPWAGEVDLRGRSLVLVPSALHWWRPACIVDAPWQPTLVYPARGLALLWQASRRVDGALGAVVGRTRATLLAALDAPRSTTELASALGLSAGGVSAHLTALRNAGLVSSTRHGHSVLYARTPIADQLLTPQEGAETVPS
jgi:DNA-binding transcriptional ArsR family regulator